MNEEELIADIEQTIKDIELGETDYTVSNIEAEVKKILLQGDNKIGIAVSTKGGYKARKYNPENLPQEIKKAMPNKIFDLVKKFGIGFPSDIIHYERGQGGPYEETLFSTEFIPVNTAPYSENIFIFIDFYEKSPEWQIEEVEKRQKKVKRFQEKVSKSTDGKYDKKGILSLPKYSTNTGYSYEYNEKDAPPRAWITDFIEIEMTQRELAEAGLLPDDFKWVEKSKVSARDIAEASKEKSITTTEVNGIRGFMRKLLDKFKGIGEKG